MRSTTIPTRILLVVASLLIGAFPCNLSAGPWKIGVSVDTGGLDNADDALMENALLRELGKLDGVEVESVGSPLATLNMTCVVAKSAAPRYKIERGYACVAVVTLNDYRLVTHYIQSAPTIDALAPDIATRVDRDVIQKLLAGLRSSENPAQPSSSP